MKVYISLPITGKDLQEQKGYARHVASFLSEAGFTPVNPFDNGFGSCSTAAQSTFAMVTTTPRVAFSSVTWPSSAA